LASPRVLVDTSAWIELLNRPDSPEKRSLDALIDSDRVALCGVVVAELLQGTRTKREFALLRERLAVFPLMETTHAVWQRAAELAFQLRRKGVTLPLTDLAVAATAMTNSLLVFAKDVHFDRIPGLRLYQH